MALTDSLTDVYTRRYLFERFEEELRRAENRKSQLSLLMVDVDFFKKFNDQHGHITGDQILRKISAIIKENVREIDIVGRYGGEEFAVVLPDTDSAGASFVAERIRSATERAIIKVYDTTVKATISIGIALYPNHGQSPVSLIDNADQALYSAKTLGRNRIAIYNPRKK
jgi:diguanylate cyclase (GGDEF)-like protein